jgi:hypothetical protein
METERNFTVVERPIVTTFMLLGETRKDYNGGTNSELFSDALYSRDTQLGWTSLSQSSSVECRYAIRRAGTRHSKKTVGFLSSSHLKFGLRSQRMNKMPQFDCMQKTSKHNLQSITAVSRKKNVFMVVWRIINAMKSHSKVQLGHASYQIKAQRKMHQIGKTA